MSLEEIIKVYKSTFVIPGKYHLNWLKENVNPVLKEIDNNIKINWACSNCVKNYMNMLLGWYDRQQIKCKEIEINKPKKRGRPKKNKATN
jgi:hypothetical protein